MRARTKPHVELHHRRWDGHWDVCIEIPRKKRGYAKLPIVDVYWRGPFADVPTALHDAKEYIPMAGLAWKKAAKHAFRK